MNNERRHERRKIEQIGLEQYLRRLEHMRYRLRATWLPSRRARQQLKRRIRAAEWTLIELKVAAVKGDGE